MVYYGPSKGCLTCKRRRKKCDASRPSCLRCIEARRACGGYEAGARLRFTNYDNQARPISFVSSIARKCTLPPCHGAEDVLPVEVSDQETNLFAIQAFLYEFCVRTDNHCNSKGFLSRLEPLLQTVGLDSDLANACRAVAFASHAVPLSRPALRQKSGVLYESAVCQFASQITSTYIADLQIKEAVFIPTLMGLYEIIVADGSNASFLNVHARGIAAVLHSDTSPIGILQAARRTFKRDIFSLTSSAGSYLSLDDLLLHFASLWISVEASVASGYVTALDRGNLEQEAIRLNQQLLCWCNRQPSNLKAETVFHISNPLIQHSSEIRVGYWPGAIDTYVDLYTAAVWNTYRTVRFLLLCIIDADKDQVSLEADALLNEVVSSIPYHLAEDLHSFTRSSSTGEDFVHGRAIGGLLLMQPLYVLSKNSRVPFEMRKYLKRCLLEIGQRSGIGLSNVYAKHEEGADCNQMFINASIVIIAGLLT